MSKLVSLASSGSGNLFVYGSPHPGAFFVITTVCWHGGGFGWIWDANATDIYAIYISHRQTLQNVDIIVNKRRELSDDCAWLQTPASNFKQRTTLGCLDQYTCRWLRLWISQGLEAARFAMNVSWIILIIGEIYYQYITLTINITKLPLSLNEITINTE